MMIVYRIHLPIYNEEFIFHTLKLKVLDYFEDAALKLT